MNINKYLHFDRIFNANFYKNVFRMIHRIRIKIDKESQTSLVESIAIIFFFLLKKVISVFNVNDNIISTSTSFSEN